MFKVIWMCWFIFMAIYYLCRAISAAEQDKQGWFVLCIFYIFVMLTGAVWMANMAFKLNL